MSDAKDAQNILKALYEHADGLLRERAAERSTKQLEYLRGKIAEVANLEHRQAVVELMSQEERKLMLSKVNLPYAAQIVAGPSLPLYPTSPKAATAAALGALGGLGIGAALALWRDRRRSPAVSEGWELGRRDRS
jgi:LPS O-antigen subunit length determinant protein (WzzB/FepE family)